eukprot:scaffold25307_cov109-Isochrysis_galbana.AAC.2
MSDGHAAKHRVPSAYLSAEPASQLTQSLAVPPLQVPQDESQAAQRIRLSIYVPSGHAARHAPSCRKKAVGSVRSHEGTRLAACITRLASAVAKVLAEIALVGARTAGQGAALVATIAIRAERPAAGAARVVTGCADVVRVGKHPGGARCNASARVGERRAGRRARCARCGLCINAAETRAVACRALQKPRLRIEINECARRAVADAGRAELERHGPDRIARQAVAALWTITRAATRVAGRAATVRDAIRDGLHSIFAHRSARGEALTAIREGRRRCTRGAIVAV